MQSVIVNTQDAKLEGNLTVPDNANGLVVFVHGSGSSRHSPRNQQVAAQLNAGGLATLLFDLLTAKEDAVDRRTREHRFNIPLLAQRTADTVDWVRSNADTRALDVGLFGASTGAAAALIAASRRESVKAVVSRGGRPDLADQALPEVEAPTLLIVGGNDTQVITLNQQALNQMHGKKQLEVIPGASHLFEEPGKLEQVARLTIDWFRRYF